MRAETSTTADATLIMRCSELHLTAFQLSQGSILTKLRDLASSEPGVYAFKSRVKSTSKVHKKVERKRSEGHKLLSSNEAATSDIINAQAIKDIKYSPDNVTDILGCRFIVLFQSDIPNVVKRILILIDNYNKSGEKDIVQLHEMIVYTNRPRNDPLSIASEIEQIAKSIDISNPMISNQDFFSAPVNRKSAYSSVHFVFSQEIKMEHAGHNTKTNEIAKFELQIRDIFEEAWGEVQHQLIYSDKDNVTIKEEEQKIIDENWQIHLNALKTFADGCSQHASIIKRNRDQLVIRKTVKAINESISNRKEDCSKIIAALRTGGASQDIRNKVDDFYILLEKTETCKNLDEFHNIFDVIYPFKSSLIDGMETRYKNLNLSREDSYIKLSISYFLSIEFANAIYAYIDIYRSNKGVLPSSNDLRNGIQIKNAILIYQSILENNKNDPTIHYRLARSIIMECESIEKLINAISLLDLSIKESNDSTKYPHNSIIRQLSRITCGLYNWKLAELFYDHQNYKFANKHAKRAYKVTYEIYELWLRSGSDTSPQSIIGTHKSLGNCIYYISRSKGRFHVFNTHKDIKLNISTILFKMNEMKISNYADYYKTRDNMMHGYHEIGQMENAKEFALETYNELRTLAELRNGNILAVEEVDRHLLKHEKPSFNSARQFLGIT